MKAMEMADVGVGEVRCLEDVAKQFKDWRQSRVRGERIPAALWGEAVRLCPQHTPQRVAGVLRIALASLMQRLGRSSDGGAPPPGLDAEFVELIMSTPLAAMPGPVASKLKLAPPPEPPGGAATPGSAHECLLELENMHGAKMRVQLNGAGLASLGLLCSSFWSAR